ncbi:TraB/GumN family protein [Mesorhizobium xinjiangense]|uniref:TraB/GumN family protein n=1 Tax=Mesorhizobium xinjiangense TaxID=2678685 RepID=UPI0012EEBD43|nr:TraB/GumN family protein [Mesorhizobium xinjiangense]
MYDHRIHAPTHDIGEPATTLALRVLAVLNTLFFLGFLLVASLAASNAHAADGECTGEDLVSQLERNDPDALAAIHAEAAATPNGRGLLWKVEKAGTEPSWLFGTMHMTDPRVTQLPEEAGAAFEASKTVVVETTEILDQKAMMAAMMKHPELTMYTGDETLFSRLSAADRELVEQALEARGVPPASVQRMKPWMLTALVTLPACELARKAEGAAILDAKLARQAKQQGKSLAGLETAVGQLQAMASLPMEFHIEGLVDTLRLGGRMDDVMETMIRLYAAGEIGMIWPLFRSVLPNEETDGPGYAAFEERLIKARNRTMAENAAPLIDKGGAFIAVGALHLPGEEGLVEVLRRQGYSVSPGT